MIVLAYHYDKIPEKTDLKKEKFIWFTVSKILIQNQADYIPLGLGQGRNMVMEGHGRGKLLTSGYPGSREPLCLGASSSSAFVPYGPPAYEMVLSTFRDDFAPQFAVLPAACIWSHMHWYPTSQFSKVNNQD